MQRLLIKFLEGRCVILGGITPLSPPGSYAAGNSDVHNYEYYQMVDLLNISIQNTRIKHGFLNFYELSF